jgi:hypothetical protein
MAAENGQVRRARQEARRQRADEMAGRKIGGQCGFHVLANTAKSR